jgi:hypothetical protein
MTTQKFLSKTWYHTKFWDPTVNRIIIVSTSKIDMAAIMILLKVAPIVFQLFNYAFLTADFKWDKKIIITGKQIKIWKWSLRKTSENPDYENW